MADDRVSAEVAAIEHRGRIAYNDYDAPPRKDWDALIAAVEAGLKAADEMAGRHATDSALDEDRMWIRQECAGKFRAAIEHALTGEESSDGH